MTGPPRIVVTVTATANRMDAETILTRIWRYGDAIRRHGGDPFMLDATSSGAEREAAFAAMEGLVLSGGVDMDPVRYGRPNRGSVDVQPDRDELEAQAWSAAERRDVPALGICRGFQVINVLMGGSLLQHVDGHRAGDGTGPPVRHPLHVAPGTRLARMLFPDDAEAGAVEVNSFHHQAVRAADLAPGLVASGWAPSPAGDLVEAIESPGGARLVLGLQCHPERTDSTSPAFERLWSAFVDACRRPVRRSGQRH